METPGSADQKYNLAFQVVDNLPPSDPVQVSSHHKFSQHVGTCERFKFYGKVCQFQMSWGIVERVRDKNYVTPSIDDILAGLPGDHLLLNYTLY